MFLYSFGSDFGGGSSFTPWMKEHVADYIDAHYISLEQHNGTWGPHIFHWSRFDWTLDSCMHYSKHNEWIIYIIKVYNNIIRMYIKEVPHQEIMKVLIPPSE